jgi:16S rRNA (guanine(1405)-N(7))-methyltransferase
MSEELAIAVEEISRARKYRDLCTETIRDVVALEFSRHKSSRVALQSARQRLHRLWAQFLGAPDYDTSTRDLDAAFSTGDDRQIEDVCRRIMNEHASTRERLGELDELYAKLFARTGPPERIMDLASALNPFSFRWMKLPRTVRYHAYDINRRIVDLTNHYFRLEGLLPLAAHQDVLCSPPVEPADVALLFKMYHCLEHRQRGAGWRVVAAVPAQWVAVSFPTRNLRFQSVDILGNYEEEIRAESQRRGWALTEIPFNSEVIVLIRKGDGSGGPFRTAT